MAAPIVAHRRWAVSIVALSRLPPPGTEVCYFARGHAEQWLGGPGAPEVHEHGVPCSVTTVDYFTNGEEPCARISLLPLPAADDHNRPPAADDHNPPPAGSFRFFVKTITQADKQRNFFTVPRVCEPMFPPFQAGENEREVKMQDISGRSWNMVRKNQGATRSLGGQWRNFVDDKGAVVDDTIMFVRRPDDEILVDLRRRVPQPMAWGVDDVAAASLLVIQGGAFTITYYPGRVQPFIVPRAVVDAAAGTEWEVGMEVRLRPKDEVVPLQEQGAAAGVTSRGTIAAVIPGATWRNLQVDWDAGTPSTLATSVNMWQVEPEGARVAKKPKLSHKGVRLFGKTIVPQEGSGSAA